MKGVHHSGVTVSNLDDAIDFYHGVLGLQFANEPTAVFDGPEIGQTVGVPGAALRQVALAAGQGIVELLEYVRPLTTVRGPFPQNAPGAHHLAFLVDDIQATKAALEAKGVRFFSEVNGADDGVLAGWRWVYFADPDGTVLELVEVAYTRPEERHAGIAAYLEHRVVRKRPRT